MTARVRGPDSTSPGPSALTGHPPGNGSHGSPSPVKSPASPSGSPADALCGTAIRTRRVGPAASMSASCPRTAALNSS